MILADELLHRWQSRSLNSGAKKNSWAMRKKRCTNPLLDRPQALKPGSGVKTRPFGQNIGTVFVPGACGSLREIREMI
jgi:hypothetical protein